jgi:hypothetical protein
LHPSSIPKPRYDFAEVLFALSYEALKIQEISSDWAIAASSSAIVQTNNSDSMTHGPRIKSGVVPLV